MAASVSMCLRSMKQMYYIPSSLISAFRNSYRIQQKLSYSATSAAFNQSTSTAEKSQTAEARPTEDVSVETKSEELSAKEKELLSENEKLLENVQNLDMNSPFAEKYPVPSHSTGPNHFALQLEWEQSWDKYKRALAENENVRIRMRREISDAKQYGIQNFVKDLVEVADVLGKATESVPKDALKSNTHLKCLFEGLQMTEAQLHSVFRRYGVTQINPIGEKFNPNHHEALFEQVDSSKEPGTVGTVTKIGYKLHDRVVRPAMVGVIKGSS